MKISLYMTPSCVLEGSLAGAAVIVIDALRMTSTAATAFENGCEALCAVKTVEEALAMRECEGVLLGGERGGRLIPGFELDNSPLNFTKEAVCGQKICMTTSNGTQAIAAVRGAKRVLLGAFVNAAACAAAVETEEEVAIVCAGTGGRLSLEDVLAGGAMIERLERAGKALELDDAAIAARRLYEAARGDLAAALTGTYHYGMMMQREQEGDLDVCLSEDTIGAVPEMDEAGWFRNAQDKI